MNYKLDIIETAILGVVMRMLSLLILASLATTAVYAKDGEQLYPCTFKASLKGESSSSWSKNFYLSNKRSIKASFGSSYKTEIDVRVDNDGKLSGYVNGQRNFVLEGTTEKGNFESAHAVGTISCGAAQTLNTAYLFKPWNNLHLNDGQFDVIQNTPQLTNTCYVGSAGQALADYKALYGATAESVDLTVKEKSVMVVKKEKVCLQYNGQHPAEGGRCLVWSPIKISKSYLIDDCDYSDPDLDRS